MIVVDNAPAKLGSLQLWRKIPWQRLGPDDMIPDNIWSWIHGPKHCSVVLHPGHRIIMSIGHGRSGQPGLSGKFSVSRPEQPLVLIDGCSIMVGSKAGVWSGQVDGKSKPWRYQDSNCVVAKYRITGGRG